MSASPVALDPAALPQGLAALFAQFESLWPNAAPITRFTVEDSGFDCRGSAPSYADLVRDGLFSAPTAPARQVRQDRALCTKGYAIGRFERRAERERCGTVDGLVVPLPQPSAEKRTRSPHTSANTVTQQHAPRAAPPVRAASRIGCAASLPPSATARISSAAAWATRGAGCENREKSGRPSSAISCGVGKQWWQE